MKTVKTLIILGAFIVMIALIVDQYFLLELTEPNKNVGAYVGVAGMAVLLVALIFVSFAERKKRKTEQKIEEKDQEIGRLQQLLKQSNDVINIVPSKGNDVEM